MSTTGRRNRELRESFYSVSDLGQFVNNNSMRIRMNKNLCRDVTIAIVRVYVVNVNVRASMREYGKTRGGIFDIFVLYTAIVLIRLYQDGVYKKPFMVASSSAPYSSM